MMYPCIIEAADKSITVSSGTGRHAVAVKVHRICAPFPPGLNRIATSVFVQPIIAADLGWHT